MKKNYIYLLFFTLLLASCGDFLDPKFATEFNPKEASSLNDMLLKEAYPNYIKGDQMGVVTILDDDIQCHPNISNNVYIKNAYFYDAYFLMYTWQPDCIRRMIDQNIQEDFFDAYSQQYKFIAGANSALDLIDKVSGTESEKNLVQAQAHALRAFHYFNLVNLYASSYAYDKNSLGVPLKLISSLETRPLYRNTVEEVYNQVIGDLLLAEKCYSKVEKDVVWRKNFRTSLPMVQLLLSRVYLYMERWEDAAKYSKMVIEDWTEQFSLVALDGLASRYNFIDYNCPEVLWLYNAQEYNGQFSRKRFLQESNDFLFFASNQLVNSYDTDDLRKTYFLIKDGTNYKSFGKVGLQATNDPDGGKFSKAFRLSEAYLNYVEAQINRALIGDNIDLSEVLVKINTLRTKRYKQGSGSSITITDKNELLDFIKEERRRELCFESHRWFDLKRWGMSVSKEWRNEEGVKKFTLEANDPAFNLPFCPKVIEGNPDLVQNPFPKERGESL